MTYDTELASKHQLGSDSSRNLSTEKIFRLLAMGPDVDKEAAMEVLRQVPELASLSKAALTDIEPTYRATLEASAQSAGALHEAAAEERAIIRAALESDPTNESLWRRLAELTDLEAAKDSERRQFARQLYEAKVHEKVAVIAVVAGAVLVGLTSGGRSAGGIGRVISAVRDAA